MFVDGKIHHQKDADSPKLIYRLMQFILKLKFDILLSMTSRF